MLGDISTHSRAVWAKCQIFQYLTSKGKSERVPVTGPVVAQRLGRGIALLYHDRGTRRR